MNRGADIASRSVRPAVQARRAAGFSVADAAKRAMVSEGYLRRTEREGAPYLLARRLAVLYQCGVEAFLPPAASDHRKEGRRRHQ